MTCAPPGDLIDVVITPSHPVELGHQFELECRAGYCEVGGASQVQCHMGVIRHGYSDNLLVCRKEADYLKNVYCIHDRHRDMGFQISSGLIDMAINKVAGNALKPKGWEPIHDEDDVQQGLEGTTSLEINPPGCNACVDEMCTTHFVKYRDKLAMFIRDHHRRWVGCAINFKTKYGICYYALQ